MTKMLKVVGASWLQTKISSYILGTLGLLAIVALFLGEIERIQDDGNYAATVFWSERSGYHIEYWGQSNELASVPRGAARAYYRQDFHTAGWSLLELETDGSYPDHVQAYAAGLLEGALTWESVHAHLAATVHAQCARAEKECDRVRDQLERAANVDKNKVALYEDNQPFWHQVGLFYTQIDGIYTGWKHGVERNLKEYEIEKSDLYWLNAISEIKEMKKHLNISLDDQVAEQLPGLSSAFLNILNETIDLGENITSVNKKLFLAHNTAGSYGSMLRILKRYKLNYHLTDAAESPPVPGAAVEFSSYPAAVTSHDEMYVVSGAGDHLLAISGTAITNFNTKLWKKVNIVDQVPVGPRVAAANHLATNVSHWVHILASNNSGTGCKQWMVVDLARLDRLVQESSRDILRRAQSFQPINLTATENNYQLDIGSAILETLDDHSTVTYEYITENKDVRHTTRHRVTSEGRSRNRVQGLFWLLEQVPGYAHSGDLSDALLDQGYWATYGLPYFKDIAEMTDLSKMEARYGDVFSSSNSPRAAVFREAARRARAPDAADIDRILRVMRSLNTTALARGGRAGEAEAAGEAQCAGGARVRGEGECVLLEREYWVQLGVRGDLAQQYPRPYGLLDTKLFTYDCARRVKELIAVPGPAHSPPPEGEDAHTLNKGNVALAHKQHLDIVNNSSTPAPGRASTGSDSPTVPPFQWSRSRYADRPHDLQPDKWQFPPARPAWVW